jgi:hypothetical protein
MSNLCVGTGLALGCWSREGFQSTQVTCGVVGRCKYNCNVDPSSSNSKLQVRTQETLKIFDARPDIKIPFRSVLGEKLILFALPELNFFTYYPAIFDP